VTKTVNMVFSCRTDLFYFKLLFNSLNMNERILTKGFLKVQIQNHSRSVV